jgi:hypothetical protein
MAFAAQLGSIGRIGTGLRPPKTARTEQLSTAAHDQSIWPLRPSQSSSTKWIRSQMPACCQSRRRLQQVIPEPHANSRGNISQGMPLRSTNRIPAKQARLHKRGRPPLALHLGDGRRGSTRFHNASGSRTAGISNPPHGDCGIPNSLCKLPGF